MPSTRISVDGHTPCAHRVYWMTCEEFDDLARQADGHCMRCQGHDSLSLDHDHSVGRWAVRGLVCHSCNCLLGHVDGKRWPMDDATMAYLGRAWFKGREPRTGPPKQPRRPRRQVPPPSDLGKYVGVHEVAALLGLSRQRIDQLARKGNLPEPDVVLAGGTIWRTDDIRAWAKRNGRKIRGDDET